MRTLKSFLLNEGKLNEKTGAKVLRIIGGQVPQIDTYALLTAENPSGEEHGTKENEEYNKHLEEKLRNLGLGFYKVKGKFLGNVEHSYLFPNMSENDVTELGNEFGQQAVIYGEKSIGSTGKPIMLHKYIEDGKVTKTRKSFKNLAADLEDMYTKTKGKKFEIPFFEPKERGAELVGGKKVQAEPSSDIEEPSATIPTERPGRSEFTKGKIRLTNTNDRIVWVNKENEKNYLQQGYKKVKEA